ncbi:MAG: lysylphosphatidylglycerol synthase domain-containing protein [Actinomycetota bacterium]|nr:lysylphosphatidylglycerol synthase domain-containing protein [Actinomycetota bacterium]
MGLREGIVGLKTKRLAKTVPTWLLVSLSLVFGLVALVVVLKAVDLKALRMSFDEAFSHPLELSLAFGAFALAFIFRAVAWKKVIPSLPFKQSLAGIHMALGANHVLPFRIGEAARITSVARRTDLPLEIISASTLALRTGDFLALAALGLLVAPGAFASLIGPIGWFVFGIVTLVAVGSWRWLFKLVGLDERIRLPGPLAIALSVSAWVCEAVLVIFAARWAGIEITFFEAIFVTVASVGAQIVAVAPGGFGTYEGAAVAAYLIVGVDARLALIAALTTHALKTSYSLILGSIALIRPKPSLFPRFRLRKEKDFVTSFKPESSAPVVLFMPAFNEQASVGECVRRVPKKVAGRPVKIFVVNDGSSDRTSEEAVSAGAEVIEMGVNQGLGAAVRRGFEESTRLGAAAVAFCDADCEYAPEELEAMVRPILDGDADYVIGSRFAGHIEHMRPHRRFGNKVLTLILCIVALERITDGQSGYRALSPEAAASAEIIHDFNYAQVLTLDLLAKGFRYQEVPISYHFRTSGESFVKLGKYLRKVCPAVLRELNTV